MSRSIPLLLMLAACAPQPQINPGDYTPHGAFAPSMERDRAFLECRLVAESAGRQMLSSGVPGALPTLYGPPPLVVQTVRETHQTCMESKGFRRAQ